MHKSSYSKMEYFKNNYLNVDDELKILDIGSFDKNGNFNYGLIMDEDKWTYHGLDLYEGNNVDIVIEDPYNWKEIDNSVYDLVISGQAFEHIEYFWITMGEINRVLKPGGLCCIIAPSGGPVHKNPYDCYRFRDDGMKSLAEYVNFEVLEFGTNEDKNSHPWYDSYLIAKKPINVSYSELELRLNNLEYKVDLIIKNLSL